MATKTARLLKQNESSNANSAMAKLLAAKDAKLPTFSKRDIVKGKITKLTRQEILVDLDSKAEALVLEKDRRILRTLLESLKVGDEVTVSILSPESENGYPVVSLRRFVEDKSWDNLAKIQSQREMVTVEVLEITKGGYVVRMESGVQGFLPQSHIVRTGSGESNPGDKLSVYVQDLKRQDSKVIFSQKQSLSLDEFKAVMQQYKKEQKVKVTVENVTSFGVFVSLPFVRKGADEESKIDGLIHISEVSWQKTEDISGDFKVGQELEAVVIGFDTEAKRVDLSLKRLSADPFTETAKRYPVDKKVEGKVVKVVDGNLQIELEEGVEGVVRKEKVPPNKTFNTGDTISLVVTSLDARRRKIELSPVLLAKPIGYR